MLKIKSFHRSSKTVNSMEERERKDRISHGQYENESDSNWGSENEWVNGGAADEDRKSYISYFAYFAKIFRPPYWFSHLPLLITCTFRSDSPSHRRTMSLVRPLFSVLCAIFRIAGHSSFHGSDAISTPDSWGASSFRIIISVICIFNKSKVFQFWEMMRV